MGVWIAISAIATVFIAILALSNYKLAREVQESREKQDIDLKKLLHAMVISNIIPTTGSYYDSLEIFVRHYPYPTEILNKEELENFRLLKKEEEKDM